MGRDTDAEALGLHALAAHEAGHGVICAALGIQVVHVTLTATSGHTKHRGHNDLDAELLILLAGQEAQARWVQRHVSGYGFGSALRYAKRCSAHDMRDFRRLVRRSALSEGTARSHCRSLVRKHWGRIDRAADRLARTGHVSGSSL
jgi:hypothetical protein